MKKSLLLLTIPVFTIAILGANLLLEPVKVSALPGIEVEPNQEIIIMGMGNGECIGSSGDSGNAKIKATYYLLVKEVDDSHYSGVAMAKMDILTKCDGIPKKLTNNFSLLFNYDKDFDTLTISGELKSKDGRTFVFDQQGTISPMKGPKFSMDSNLQISGPQGLELSFPMFDSTVSWDEGCRHCTQVD